MEEEKKSKKVTFEQEENEYWFN